MRRALVVAALVVAGCAARTAPAPQLAVPPSEAGRVAGRAMAGAPLGEVQPIAVALTNGSEDGLRLDARQIYALDAAGARVAPVVPGEAARLSGGKGAPGALKGAAKGAVSGGIFGAIGGVISGAIVGGSVGLATAAGSAAGAAIGAITGGIGGSQSAPDVRPFQDQALASTTLAPGFSATGYLYYPLGAYGALDVLLQEDATGTVVEEQVAVDPAP